MTVPSHTTGRTLFWLPVRDNQGLPSQAHIKSQTQKQRQHRRKLIRHALTFGQYCVCNEQLIANTQRFLDTATSDDFEMFVMCLQYSILWIMINRAWCSCQMKYQLKSLPQLELFWCYELPHNLISSLLLILPSFPCTSWSVFFLILV